MKQNRNKLHATRAMLHVKGFTLIEFLVVFTIITLVVPSLFGLTFTLIRQQSRIIALQVVKRQGDLVLNHMKTTIRNSAVGTFNGSLGSPVATCTTAGSSSSGSAMYFQNTSATGSYFGYSRNGTTLQYEKTGQSNTALTNSSVTVSSLTIACSRSSDFGTPTITIAYTVAEPINTISLNYQTTIKLRPH